MSLHARLPYLLTLLAGCTTSTSGAKQVNRYKEPIMAQLERQRGEDVHDFALRPAPHWDQRRLTVIEAYRSDARLVEQTTVYFAVLPSGEILSSYDRPLQLLVERLFPKPTADDADAIAQLASMFGDYGAPVGRYVPDLMAVQAHLYQLPRPNGTPTYTREGAAHLVCYFSDQPKIPALYDCCVRIEAGKVSLAAKEVPQARPLGD